MTVGGEINVIYSIFLLKLVICSDDELQYQFESSTCLLQPNARVRLHALVTNPGIKNFAHHPSIADFQDMERDTHLSKLPNGWYLR